MNFIHSNEQVQPIFGQWLIILLNFWDALNWISSTLDATDHHIRHGPFHCNILTGFCSCFFSRWRLHDSIFSHNNNFFIHIELKPVLFQQ